MTPEKFLEKASENGYSVEGKSISDVLVDRQAFKAFYAGQEDVRMHRFSCQCGNVMEAKTHAWVKAFIDTFVHLENGKTPEEVVALITA